MGHSSTPMFKHGSGSPSLQRLRTRPDRCGEPCEAGGATARAPPADRRGGAGAGGCHRLSARLRHPAAAHPGRHPDRDPATRRCAAAGDACPAPRTGREVGLGPGAPPRPREAVITESRADAGKTVARPIAKERAACNDTCCNPWHLPPKPPRRPWKHGPPHPRPMPRVRRPCSKAKRPPSRSPRPRSPRTVAAKEPGRFVVQVGAFADAAAARETRSKVEKLGFKTYTQVVDTASGSRIACARRTVRHTRRSRQGAREGARRPESTRPC